MSDSVLCTMLFVVRFMDKKGEKEDGTGALERGFSTSTFLPFF